MRCWPLALVFSSKPLFAARARARGPWRVRPLRSLFSFLGWITLNAGDFSPADRIDLLDWTVNDPARRPASRSTFRSESGPPCALLCVLAMGASRGVVREAGFLPVERDTLYNPIVHV